MLLYKIKNFTKKFYSRINRYRYFDKYIDENHTKYHHDSIIDIHKKINLRDKYILDIGGSNINHELMKKLRAKRFVCIDNISKWMSYHESTADNMYMGKKIVSIDSNLNNIEDFSYIIDSCSENRIESFKNYFDLVVSFSTFEHVDSIIKTMNNIHHYLKDGGVCFVTYEPIYSCAVGHHYYIDHEKYNFQVDRSIDFCHLLQSKSSLYDILKNMDYPDDIIKKIIYQTYESDIINRKFFKEHILEIMSSNFNNYQISYWNIMDVDPEILKILAEKYGYSRYDVRGIKIYATK